MLGSNAWMVIAGAGLLAVGLLLRRWSGRHDLRDAAIDSAQAIEQTSFDEAADAAAKAARPLDEVNILCAAGVLLLALFGLFQRLREYRT